MAIFGVAILVISVASEETCFYMAGIALAILRACFNCCPVMDEIPYILSEIIPLTQDVGTETSLKIFQITTRFLIISREHAALQEYSLSLLALYKYFMSLFARSYSQTKLWCICGQAIKRCYIPFCYLTEKEAVYIFSLVFLWLQNGQLPLCMSGRILFSTA